MPPRKPGDGAKTLDALNMLWRRDKPGFIRGLSTDERAVLTALLMHGDSPRNCYPSLETIAEEAGMSKSQAIRTLTRLASPDRRLIRRHRVPPPGRTRYTVSIGNGAQWEQSEPPTVPNGNPTVPNGNETVPNGHFDSAQQTPEVISEAVQEGIKEVGSLTLSEQQNGNGSASPGLTREDQLAILAQQGIRPKRKAHP